MREYNDRLHAMASHDSLTQVFNARAYYAACEQQIALSERSDQAFSVLFIDLDHFKSIIDPKSNHLNKKIKRHI